MIYFVYMLRFFNSIVVLRSCPISYTYGLFPLLLIYLSTFFLFLRHITRFWPFHSLSNHRPELGLITIILSPSTILHHRLPALDKSSPFWPTRPRSLLFRRQQKLDAIFFRAFLCLFCLSTLIYLYSSDSFVVYFLVVSTIQPAAYHTSAQSEKGPLPWKTDLFSPRTILLKQDIFWTYLPKAPPSQEEEDIPQRSSKSLFPCVQQV